MGWQKEQVNGKEMEARKKRLSYLFKDFQCMVFASLGKQRPAP